ncbi:hypothetical protein [Planctobacterium marinum]|uniref:hypothetical protein n=1 Tax=Planctobacterium marinum TaxID=1631968 RepID=UPI001E5CCB72|nr:hypothetical protein [Planctobacterium marinum]MCC2606381.1 hypothetical protein [Planctobacterium marinum]
MKQLSLFGNIAILFSAFYSQLCFAHGDAHYLGNSAVLVQTEQKKSCLIHFSITILVFINWYRKQCTAPSWPVHRPTTTSTQS